MNLRVRHHCAAGVANGAGKDALAGLGVRHRRENGFVRSCENQGGSKN
jgi:hypothetical protein